jgi:hypothetical protein
VDIQSTARQRVLSNDIIESVPTARSYSALGVLLPGVNNSALEVGSSAGAMNSLSAHGSSGGDQRILQNGLNVSTLQVGTGNISGMIPNQSGAQEVAIDTSGLPPGGRRAASPSTTSSATAAARSELQLLHLRRQRHGRQQPDEPRAVRAVPTIRT